MYSHGGACACVLTFEAWSKGQIVCPDSFGSLATMRWVLSAPGRAPGGACAVGRVLSTPRGARRTTYTYRCAQSGACGRRAPAQRQWGTACFILAAPFLLLSSPLILLSLMFPLEIEEEFASIVFAPLEPRFIH